MRIFILIFYSTSSIESPAQIFKYQLHILRKISTCCAKQQELLPFLGKKIVRQFVLFSEKIMQLNDFTRLPVAAVAPNINSETDGIIDKAIVGVKQ